MDSFTYTITLVVGGLVVIVGIIAVVGGIYAIGVWYPRQVNRKIDELKARGRLGEATVLRLPQLRRHGASKALYRSLEIGLEIRVPGVEKYEVDKAFLIPSGAVHHLEPGKIVPVWIDPNNPRDLDKIVIHLEY